MCPSSCAKRPIDLEVMVSLRQFVPPEEEKKEAEKARTGRGKSDFFKKGKRTIDSKAEGAKEVKMEWCGGRAIVHKEAGVCR